MRYAGVLKGGWQQLSGVSCAGWDIWLCKRNGMSAFFWRRLEPAKEREYTLGRTFSSIDSGQEALKHIRWQFSLDRFDPDLVQADHTNPNFGRF
jgi:hypothetical protein